MAQPEAIHVSHPFCLGGALASRHSGHFSGSGDVYAVAYRRPQHLFGYVWQQSLSHNRAMPWDRGRDQLHCCGICIPLFFWHTLCCAHPLRRTPTAVIWRRDMRQRKEPISSIRLSPPPPMDYAICHGGWYQPTTVLLFCRGKFLSFFLGRVVVYSSRQVQESYQGNK